MAFIPLRLTFPRWAAAACLVLVLALTAESKWTKWLHPYDEETDVNGWIVQKLSVRYSRPESRARRIIGSALRLVKRNSRLAKNDNVITALHFTASRPQNGETTASPALGRRPKSPFVGTLQVDCKKGRLVLGKPTDTVEWKVWLIFWLRCGCMKSGIFETCPQVTFVPASDIWRYLDVGYPNVRQDASYTSKVPGSIPPWDKVFFARRVLHPYPAVRRVLLLSLRGNTTTPPYPWWYWSSCLLLQSGDTGGAVGAPGLPALAPSGGAKQSRAALAARVCVATTREACVLAKTRGGK